LEKAKECLVIEAGLLAVEDHWEAKVYLEAWADLLWEVGALISLTW